MTRHYRVAVIGDRCSEKSNHSVPLLFAHDTAKLSDGETHRGERRLKKRNRVLWIQSIDQIGRSEQIRAKYRDILSFIRGLEPCMLRDGGTRPEQCRAAMDAE